MVKSTHLEGLSSFAFKGAFIGGYFERTAALDARMDTTTAERKTRRTGENLRHKRKS